MPNKFRFIAKDAAGNDPNLGLAVNHLDCSRENGERPSQIFILQLKRLLLKEILLLPDDI